MNTKKLAKIIKIVVEYELKRQLPGLISEGMAKVLNEQKKRPIKKIIEKVETADPFSLANTMLDEIQQEHTKPSSPKIVEKRKLSKNPLLNEILNNTKPFKDRGGPTNYGQSTQLDESFKDMDKTVSFDKMGAQGGMDVMKSQMSAKMGYGGYTNPNTPTSAGLGVTTGLPGLDRILNRDNSELVKQFKTRK